MTIGRSVRELFSENPKGVHHPPSSAHSFNRPHHRPLAIWSSVHASLHPALVWEGALAFIEWSCPWTVNYTHHHVLIAFHLLWGCIPKSAVCFPFLGALAPLTARCSGKQNHKLGGQQHARIIRQLADFDLSSAGVAVHQHTALKWELCRPGRGGGGGMSGVGFGRNLASITIHPSRRGP